MKVKPLGDRVLIEVPEGLINPIDIALKEFELGLLPITVKRSKNA